MNADDQISEAVKRRRGWFATMWLFLILHYLLGVIALIASISVAYANEHSQALGLVSAICVGVLTFLNPDNRIKVYGNAWRRLDYAINRYSIKTINAAMVVDEMHKAEIGISKGHHADTDYEALINESKKTSGGVSRPSDGSVV